MPQHHPLYKRMRRMGVTLQDIADATGRTKSAIQKQLNSGQEPDEYVVEAVERALAEREAQPSEVRVREYPQERTIRTPLTLQQRLRKQVRQQIRNADEVRTLMLQYGVATVDELLAELDDQLARLSDTSGGFSSSSRGWADSVGDQPTKPQTPEE